MHGALVVAAECGGNVHAVGAGHTVAAAGASHFQISVDLLAHRINHVAVGLCEAADSGFIGGVYIFHNHLFGIHAGEDAGYLGLVPEPVESPLCRGALYGMLRKSFFGAVGQSVDELATP